MSTTERLLNAFLNGEQLTARQIASRFGSGNPHDLVHQLRAEGHAIYLNEHTNRKGEVTMKYRLGSPSRRMVAAAFAVLGADGFNRRAA